MFRDKHRHRHTQRIKEKKRVHEFEREVAANGGGVYRGRKEEQELKKCKTSFFYYLKTNKK